MKTITMLETLGALLLAASAVPAAHATALPLQHATIAASYNGATAGMLGVEHGFNAEPGSHISAIDPFGVAEPEFISADYQFIVDFSASGLLTVYANAPITPGSYAMRFDFGATLGTALSAFTLVDASAIGGLPLLTLIDGHTIGLDLSNVRWNGDFASFSAQLDAVAPAAVPEPASAALLLAGLAGLAGRAHTRRKRR